MFPKPFSVHLLIIERCSYAITVQWSVSALLFNLLFWPNFDSWPNNVPCPLHSSTLGPSRESAIQCSCHISLPSFSLEHFHSFSSTFMTLSFLKTAISLFWLNTTILILPLPGVSSWIEWGYVLLEYHIALLLSGRCTAAPICPLWVMSTFITQSRNFPISLPCKYSFSSPCS